MNPPSFPTLDIEVNGSRLDLRLNQPDRLNPLGPDTLVELAYAAKWCSTRSEIKVVVVSGAGRAFSAGADLSTFTGETGIPLRESGDRGRRMAEAIDAIPAITIAAVHGHCVGGGLVLAAACDLRIAAADTRFSIPEMELGIPLAWGGIPRLVREIGPAATHDLVLSCRPFGADEALALGLISRVVELEKLTAEVDELAAAVAARSMLTLRATKAAIAAATNQMVSVGAAWSDADALTSAFHDPESVAVRAKYLKSFEREVETP